MGLAAVLHCNMTHCVDILVQHALSTGTGECIAWVSGTPMTMRREVVAGSLSCVPSHEGRLEES